MNSQLEARLKELDEMHSDAPPGFDYFRSLGEVLHYSSHVSQRLGAKLKIDHSYQDATVFCSLDVPQDDPRASARPTTDVDYTFGGRFGGLRFLFSTFDRMFTVVGAAVPLFSETLPAATAVLVQHGYKYIPVYDLGGRYETPYTHPTTWFNRFFDYQ